MFCKYHVLKNFSWTFRSFLVPTFIFRFLEVHPAVKMRTLTKRSVEVESHAHRLVCELNSYIRMKVLLKKIKSINKLFIFNV